MSFRALSLGLALSLSAFALPNQAQACSCAAGAFAALPTWGSNNVPLNPQIRIIYSYQFDDDLLLRSGAGDIIPTTLDIKEQGTLFVATLTLEDSAQLEPLTNYVVVGSSTRLDFQTGRTNDVIPPGLEAISSITGGFDDGCSKGQCDTCGPSFYMSPTYVGPSDDLTPSAELLYRVNIEVNGVPPSHGQDSIILPRHFSLGAGFCTTTLEGLRVGDVVTVQGSTIDAAGLESPLTAPVSGVVEDDPDSVGCDSRGAGPLPLGSMALGLALFGGLSLRRRLR